ncbi:DNA-binding protein, partial [Streptococcus suis]
ISNPYFQCFLVGKQERYVKSKIVKFFESHCY